jgi:hypothetical protein
MWVVALIIFIGASILFNNNKIINNSSKHSRRGSYGGGIPYRNRKQIRNFIRK